MNTSDSVIPEITADERWTRRGDSVVQNQTIELVSARITKEEREK